MKTALNLFVLEYLISTAEQAETVPTVFTAAGLQNGNIPDSAISASSQYDAGHRAANGRLHKIGTTANWSSRTSNAGEWWQVDFGAIKWVGKIAIQGRYNAPQWITSFKIRYSDDNATWTEYNNGQVLAGTTGTNAVVLHDLTPFKARYVRVAPVTWLRWISARFEIYVADIT